LEDIGMSDRIALQLYTVRDVANKDYEGTVRKVAEMGYRAVETAGFPGTTPEQAARLFKELGITVVASHSPMPLGDAKNQVLETMDALGKPRLICPGVNRDYFKSVDGVKALCTLLNESNQVARANGMEFGFHNHDVEYGKLEGQYIYQLMKENLDPSVFFELDTYWIQVAGINPVDVIKEMGQRAPLLHIKDGPADAATRDAPMTAVGEGVMDVKAILAASGDIARYWIVEMDRVAGDAMEEARKSYDYLKGIQL
jgi:sugar phosphate isomerase/epimerase